MAPSNFSTWTYIYRQGKYIIQKAEKTIISFIDAKKAVNPNDKKESTAEKAKGCGQTIAWSSMKSLTSSELAEL